MIKPVFNRTFLKLLTRSDCKPFNLSHTSTHKTQGQAMRHLGTHSTTPRQNTQVRRINAD